MKAISWLFIIVAVVMGVLGSVLPSDRLSDFNLFNNFFHIAVWILGFGALLKYLLCCSRSDEDEE